MLDPTKGRTQERVVSSWRLVASGRNTSNRASSDRAQREASYRGSKPIRKDLGLANDCLRSLASGNGTMHGTQRVAELKGQRHMDQKRGLQRERGRKPTTKKRPPKGEGHREGPELPKEICIKVFVPIEKEIEKDLTQRGPQREESSPNGKSN